MKSIYIQLSGGLGNQLFQYALGKSISIKYKKVEYEFISGFLFEEYKRKFMIKKLISGSKPNYFITIIFLVFRVYKFFLKKKSNIYFFLNCLFIDNTLQKIETKKLNSLLKLKKKIFLLGQWQDANIFEPIKDNLYLDIINFLKNKSHIASKKLLYLSNYVALCVRSFEEVDPNKIKFIGGVCTDEFYLNSLNFYKKKKIYLFTKNKKLIPKVIKRKSIKINKMNEYSTLFFLAHFRNIILSNSTFFWWGAWLSSYKFKNNNVYSNKKFPNKNINLLHWKIMNDMHF